VLSLADIEAAVIPLAGKYALKTVSLFGSYAEGRATENSDTDFLVEFSKAPPSIFDVMGFKAELQASLHSAVDVITLPLVRKDMLTIGKTINIYG
jgi:predicted nucleotidyltransferase